PRSPWSKDSLRTRLLAVLVNPYADSTVAGNKNKGRLVVVGDIDFVNDRFARAAQENHTFVMNAVDWMSQDISLIGIRAKDRTPPPLRFSSEGLQDFAKYANVFGVPIVLIVLAAIRLLRRRQLTKRTYQPGSAVGAGATA